MSSAIGITEREVQVPGGTLYVKSWSSPKRSQLAPIILFHDSIGCVDMWRQFPQSLAAQLGRSVIAYDRLGFGRSAVRFDRPSIRFVVEEAEVYFHLVREQLAIDEFVAFGHSVGGGMAVAVGARFPQHCVAIVTESAQPFVQAQTLHSIADAKIRFDAPEELAKLARYHGEKARWVVDAWTDTWLDPGFERWNLTAELAQITCPLLAIHGDQDEYGSTIFPQVLSSLINGRGEQRILQGCGHVPHREQEDKVLDAVQDFLARMATPQVVRPNHRP